jgi:hypothetical protein
MTMRVASTQAQAISAERAAGFVRSGMWLDYGTSLNLKGKSVAERGKALVGIAHPDFREGLERQANEHLLIPRGFRSRFTRTGVRT